MTIQERFEAQARRTPHALAVVAGEEQLTYEALDASANAFAVHLGTLGVSDGSCVVLALDRSVTMIASLLGILKAGAGYVPADPDHPSERLAALVEDCDAAAIVTNKRSRSVWPAGVPLVFPADGMAVPNNSNAPLPGNNACTGPHSLAYVLFTSGSTGRPKGVMVEHHSVLNLADALHEAVYERATKPLRVSLNAPISFDASVQQIVQLLFGHTLYIVPEAVRRDGEALLAFLRDARIDVFDGTPAHLRMLYAAGFLDSGGHRPQRMLIGGEAIDQQTWGCIRSDRQTRVYNMYGPTECTVDATSCHVQSGPETPTIGQALPGYRVAILGADMRACAVGEVGEIFVGGAGVARGYLKNPELTAQRFVPDPVDASGVARLYRTGDLGRRMRDLNIEFIGREDGQVKVRGHRIELGDIEAALRRHSAIREAVVGLQDDDEGEKQLVGYLVPCDAQVQASQLRGFCREHLPQYMVPGAFMWLERLPLTANGKVDRKALPKPYAERPLIGTQRAQHTDKHEETIYGIWRDVLHLPDVGPDDDFIALGGNSLSAVRVMIRTRAAVNKLTLPLQLIFEHPRAGDFAAAALGFLRTKGIR